MEDYMDYFNCGVIIVASSITYKHQYLLKCEKCHEYFSVFDVFINHHQQLHYDQVDTEMEIKDEDDELCSLLQQNEECGTLLSDQQCDESQHYEDNQIETYSNVSSPLPSVKDDYQSPEEPDAKLLQDSPSQNDKADNVRVVSIYKSRLSYILYLLLFEISFKK